MILYEDLSVQWKTWGGVTKGVVQPKPWFVPMRPVLRPFLSARHELCSVRSALGAITIVYV